MIYAGIGSRQTPRDILAIMENFARNMALCGNILSTVGADGADAAFMRGAYSVTDSQANIYLPWSSYSHSGSISSNWTVRRSVCREALALARKHHPAWSKCSPPAKDLHARNGYVILGPDLSTPVSFVVAWTEGGRGGGGTGQGLRIARAYGIPTLDLGSCTENQLYEFYFMYREPAI